MNFLHKSFLLLSMRHQCQKDRQQDWQLLHQRDRKWFLQQPGSSPWRLLHNWLNTFSTGNILMLGHITLLVGLAGLLLGSALMAGLVQFQPLQRINLWWWLLLAVWLPAIWWLASLLFSRAHNSNLWQQLLRSRIPTNWQNSLDKPLLHLSAVSVAQQFSFYFSLGLIISFSLYLLLTDLAFGWSSTLDISTQSVYSLTRILSWPWQALWPEAVPSLQLVEDSRFFHSQPGLTDTDNTYGQWWRFLLMNLALYTLLPRLLSYTWFRWHLSQAHRRLFKQDACIADWWQRLHFENVQQQTEQTAHASLATSPQESLDIPQHDWPSLQRIAYWGLWPESQLENIRTSLPHHLQRLPRDSADSIDREQFEDNQQGLLLLCKGWEPPTGALIDYCRHFADAKIPIYLWPVPLPGMQAARSALLRQSWHMAMPDFPHNCHLLEPEKND